MHTMRMTLLSLSLAALSAAVPLRAQRRSSVLTAEEIERAKASVSTAYDLVEMFRPRWLEQHELARLPGTPNAPLRDVAAVRVYLNDVSRGDVTYLKTIPAASVLEMRWLSANEAANRFGPTDGQAAIVVTLKR
jgi:hypothetical protein